MLDTFTIKTKSKDEVIDITSEVQNVLTKGDVKEGLCVVFAQHTTCSVILGEYESGLDKDFINMVNQLKPKGPFNHAHDPDHAPSHLFSSAFGEQVSVPATNGGLALGTWQRLMLIELDGPRERKILVQTMRDD